MTNLFRYSAAHSPEINEFHVRICPGRPTPITSGGSSVWAGWAAAHTKISGAHYFKNVIFIQK